LTTSGIATS